MKYESKTTIIKLKNEQTIELQESRLLPKNNRKKSKKETKRNEANL